MCVCGRRDQRRSRKPCRMAAAAIASRRSFFCLWVRPERAIFASAAEEVRRSSKSSTGQPVRVAMRSAQARTSLARWPSEPSMLMGRPTMRPPAERGMAEEMVGLPHAEGAGGVGLVGAGWVLGVEDAAEEGRSDGRPMRDSISRAMRERRSSPPARSMGHSMTVTGEARRVTRSPTAMPVRLSPRSIATNRMEGRVREWGVVGEGRG